MDARRPRVHSINDFRYWSSKGELVLAPQFRRRRVWKPKAKSYLIDTILKGYPIPGAYPRQKTDLAGRKTMREVVDVR
ncbi:MAG: DUF262 domain-containing protein [Candidatus Thermoplasmatota archaeon]|nr:DUF262 domain-containing protein [Candidatus Thermoplasmatota archaeon]